MYATNNLIELNLQCIHVSFPLNSCIHITAWCLPISSNIVYWLVWQWNALTILTLLDKMGLDEMGVNHIACSVHADKSISLATLNVHISYNVP